MERIPGQATGHNQVNGPQPGPLPSMEAPGVDQEKPEEVKESPQRILALQESARKRVAEYLHGHVQSKLLALQYYLSRCQELLTVNPREASELLQKVRDELQLIQDKDVRQASHDLYPAIISLGLIPAVRSLRDRVDGMVRTELVVGKELAEIDGNNGRAFSEEFRIAVYRIVEEALSNVVKHSRATEATIELHYSKKGGFTLGIGDNGCGLAVSKVSFGLGLIAMRDYAEALDGGFNLESSPGRGTKIQVMLPS